MHRSDFLRSLLASFMARKLPIEVTKQFRKIYLLQCFIAGFRHYEGVALLDQLKEGDLLELVREPHNEYDSCAIALHWNGRKIGFIPADINEMLSYLLDAEALSLFAVITHLEKSARPWENVAVAVYFIQEVNKDLPAHASYLTRIEAPHYRTLKHSREDVIIEHNFEDFLDDEHRVIDLDTLPSHQTEAKEYLLKNYKRVPTLDQGTYLQVNDDGIYHIIYDIDPAIKSIKDINGESYLEFFIH